MKTKLQIQTALTNCLKAQETDDPKLCVLWPKDNNLCCLDCTCKTTLSWVLESYDPIKAYKELKKFEKSLSKGK